MEILAIIPFRWSSLMISAALDINPAVSKKILSRSYTEFERFTELKSWVLYE